MEENETVISMFQVKVLVDTRSTRKNVRQWKKARLTRDVFEVFGIKVVVGSYE